MEKRNKNSVGRYIGFGKILIWKVGLSGEKMLEIDIKRRIGGERNSIATDDIHTLFFILLLSSFFFFLFPFPAGSLYVTSTLW